MASTYVNDLRLNELGTGDGSGTWGTTTNTNLELIAEAFSYGTEAITTNADTHATTIADGSTDEGRSMFLKYTGALDSTCTVTLGPNTVSKVWIIENATTGSQSLTIKQGTGATVSIPASSTKIVYSDGAGSGGKIVDALATLNLNTSGIIETSSSIQTPLIEYTDGDDAITIADGGGVTMAAGITSTAAANSFGASSFGDADITNVGDIQLDSITGDGDTNSSITFSGSDVITVATGGSGRLTIGDGALSPVTDNQIDLGTSSLEFKDAYFDGTVTTDALVVGAVTYTATDGTDGQILTSDGSGNAAFEDAPSTGASDIDGLSDAKSGGTNFTRSLILGHQTTGTLSSASDNTAVGYTALDAITSGTLNTAVGSATLSANTTAASNTAIGYGALTTTTTGGENTAVGRSALLDLTTGTRNVAVGTYSGQSVTTGGSNTFIGYQAGDAVTTGEYNTAIGRDALLLVTTASNNTAIGTSSLDANTTGDHNVGIGAGTLGALTTATNNVAIGRDALTLSNASENVSIGAYSMDANSTGGNNVAVGYNVLGANTTGGQNTAVGHTALDANTTASDNTAFGYGALGANTTGDENVAIGKGALQAQTTAEDNTAVGTLALAATNNSRNLGVGYRALTAQSGTSDNIAIGYDALVKQTTGANGNIAIGNYAGRAVVDSASTSQLVAIGHSVASNASAALAGYQNVFIGYNIASTSALAGAFQNTALGGSAMTALSTGDQNTCIGNRAGDAITTGSNNVLIGYDSGSDALTTVSTGSNNIVLGNNSTAVAEVKVDWTVGSDERDKTDIENLPNNAGLNFVNQLRPVTYVWDNRSNYYKPTDEKYGERDHSKKSTTKQVGFIAQEVKAIEESIGWTEDHIVNTSNEQSYKLTYSQVIPMLTKAIQELSSEVDELKNKLN